MIRVSTVLAATMLLGPAVLSSNSQPAARTATAVAPSSTFQLTVDSIMRGNDLVGFAPSGLRWAADSQKLYFEWRRPGEREASTYVVGREGGDPRKMTDEETKRIPPAAGGRWDTARRRVLFVDEGDIVLLDAVAGTRRQITRTIAGESTPRWARNDTHLTYVRDGNLFLVALDPTSDALVAQLTDIGAKRPTPRGTESQSFIKDQEAELIEAVQKQREEKTRAEEKARDQKLPALVLQERQTVVDVMLSPDDTHVFVLVADRPTGAKNNIVPNYVTESGYTEDIPGRANVGDTQDRRLLAVLNLKTGRSVWAETAFAKDMIGEEPPAPQSGSRAAPEVRWTMPAISDDGAFAVASARSADNKNRWLVIIDPETGTTRVVDQRHDNAWVREAGAQFVPGAHRIWFLSERDAWMHLYTLDLDAAGATAAQLTSGKWEITAAELSPDGRTFYLTSTEAHPGERQVYSLPVGGGARTRLTSTMGSHDARISPDQRTLGVVYSYSTKPPELFLMANTPGAAATQVTITPTAEWRSFNWIDPKVITYPARDGVDVHARLFTPEMIGARRDPSRPGVVFVHGAGYTQNAHRYWASYFREYMFHNLLASRGYVVIDVDYRASSGYGRDWRTAIYRHMGGKDLEDVVDAAKYIASAEKVDPRRIGVYGGSYGGFITLMAMFTTPEVFAAGAALRPVTDWSRYDHGYTSNILNLPQQDAEAYRRSSPIYFADGLKGALLICHGMVDTNVLFQDSVRLAQRLIELRKDNWTLVPYPVENHTFSEATSWADEYTRILRLFEDNLRRGAVKAGP